MSPLERRLVELWGNEKEKAELLWGQTDADRAGIAAWVAECEAAQAGEQRAVEIAWTDTVATPLPAPVTARVLFPVWEAQTPLHDALCVALARVHLEAA